jgi:hypothetical protein
MSLDRRLREGFNRATDDIEPDVEKLLAATVVRGRRRHGIRQTAALAAVAAVAVVAAIAGAEVVERLRTSESPRPAGPPPSPGPEPEQDPYQLIDGTYLVRLDGVEDQAITDGLAGTWRMRLDPEGSLSLSPPRRLGDADEPFSGPYAYSVSGPRFQTDALSLDICRGPPGVYRWRLRGEPPGELSFTVVEDGCAARRALFASEPWYVHRG